jgi:hypothetical protein
MAKYTPPEQSKAGQLFDIAFLVLAILLALWLPLKAGWAGASKKMIELSNPTWETLNQTPAMVEQWVKLGYADAAAAAPIVLNRFNYEINWVALFFMAALLIGYFTFLFIASDSEYRDVINEKFENKRK